MTILLVDDNESVVYVVGRLFDRENLDYRSFIRTGEALDNFEAGVYSVAVLDLMMPGMSGLELAARLREIDREIPIVFCSASEPPEEMINECLAIKNARFVVKPIDQNIFIATIKTNMREKIGT